MVITTWFKKLKITPEQLKEIKLGFIRRKKGKKKELISCCSLFPSLVAACYLLFTKLLLLKFNFWNWSCKVDVNILRSWNITWWEDCLLWSDLLVVHTGSQVRLPAASVLLFIFILDSCCCWSWDRILAAAFLLHLFVIARERCHFGNIITSSLELRIPC